MILQKERKMSIQSSTYLQKALLVNAGISSLSGLTCLLANEQLTSLMGLNSSLYLYIVGAGLVVFGADVAFAALKCINKPIIIKSIIVADIGWVVGSLALVLLAPHWFSIEGIILIDFVALMVAVFATFQIIGLRRMNLPSGA
jgi:hypothetical protein